MREDEFFERLTRLRQNKGVSARDMSLSLGQSASYINKIENAKAYPSMKGFFYICEYFNIEPKDFFDTSIPNPQIMTDIMKELKKLDNKQLDYILALVKDLK